jgi:hypothetical protein
MLGDRKKNAKWAQCWNWCFKHPANLGIPSLLRAPTLSSIHWAIRIEIHQNVATMKQKKKNEPSGGLGALASNQLWNPLVTVGSNTKLNPLNHSHRNSPEFWKTKIKCKMSSVLELMLQPSSQLWNPLVTEGSNTELIPFRHTHRSSPECWKNERKKS